MNKNQEQTREILSEIEKRQKTRSNKIKNLLDSEKEEEDFK
jgi:hypothetical protein